MHQVDVLDWSVTNERFRRIIEKEHVVVKGVGEEQPL
jgi:hypothetical protein